MCVRLCIIQVRRNLFGCYDAINCNFFKEDTLYYLNTLLEDYFCVTFAHIGLNVVKILCSAD